MPNSHTAKSAVVVAGCFTRCDVAENDGSGRIIAAPVDRSAVADMR